MNQHVSTLFAIKILFFEKMSTQTFLSEIAHRTITLRLYKNACHASIGRSIPQIIAFRVFTEPFKCKIRSLEEAILHKYSEISTG